MPRSIATTGWDQGVVTADEILAKVKVVEANVRKLIDNNAK